MTTRAIFLGLTFVAALVSGEALARNPSKHELRAEKHGRVVDADTGKGIPGAKIIALWTESSSGAAGLTSGGSWCQLQKITTTDANGNYSFPDVSKDLDLSARGSHVALTPIGPIAYSHENSWRLIVFVPGYVRIGKDLEFSEPRGVYDSDQTYDDRKVLEHLVTGGTEGCKVHWNGCMNQFLWKDFPPDTDGNLFGAVAIKPIAMKKTDLAAPQAWLYYAAIQGAGQCMDRMAKSANASDFDHVASAMRSIVPPLLSSVCSMPRDAEISKPVLSSFTSWALDDDTVRRIVKAVGQREWGTKGTTAGVLCDAVGSKGIAP